MLSKSCMVTWGGGEEVGAGPSPVLWKGPPGCSLQAGGPRMVLDESQQPARGWERNKGSPRPMGHRHTGPALVGSLDMYMGHENPWTLTRRPRAL